ncbi:fluoride efflux transporter CrcB [Paenibacillus endoradicis]|uniref:fluoride efflux transporter CrcB n=1 Tax=Paenibacillus endoradicis TaxID=2972487 RepID=UPI0021595E5C|nr:fluoride efflux transporter CrcB [Paenibacillus endoradicis]MCR8656722.1 fluoride efflux transporter CrcB [Paenibacillus endoradicis]
MNVMKAYGYVAIGGFVGAIIRYVISEHWITQQPLPTLWINIIGSFLLALLYSAVTINIPWHQEIRWSLGTGLLGAFTTFSTFSVDMLRYLEQHQYWAAILYLLGSVVGGGIASIVAIIIVDKLKRKKVTS